MRLFLAFSLPTSIIEQIEILQSQLSSLVPGIKWIEKTDLHLTLIFLGKVSPPLLSLIVNAAQIAANESASVTLKFGEIDYIPSLRKPRVLGLKTTDLSRPQLQDLRLHLQKNLINLPLSPTSFKPLHLTLGRFPRLTPDQKQNLINHRQKIGALTANVPLNSWEAKSFDLIKSQLTPQKAVYTKINSFPLSIR